MLLYTMGDQAEDILYMFNLSDADKKKYNMVKQKLGYNFREGGESRRKVNR